MILLILLNSLSHEFKDFFSLGQLQKKRQTNTLREHLPATVTVHAVLEFCHDTESCFLDDVVVKFYTRSSLGKHSETMSRFPHTKISESNDFMCKSSVEQALDQNEQFPLNGLYLFKPLILSVTTNEALIKNCLLLLFFINQGYIFHAYLTITSISQVTNAK